MAELSVRAPGNVAGISASGLLLSCSALLLSSLASHSHPLFSYLIKLVSFLSPLFFTTFLVLLSLLTLSPCFGRGGTSEPFGLSSLMGVCSSILSKFRTNAKEGHGGFFLSEDSEVYRIIFEAPELESGSYGSGGEEPDPPVDKFLIYGDDGVRNKENRPVQEIACPDAEQGKKLCAMFLEKLWCETERSEETEVKAKVKAEDENFNKVVDEEKQIFHDSESNLTTGAEAKIDDDDIKNNHHDNTIFGRRRQGSRRFGESSSSRAYENVPCGREIDRNMGSFGSMSGSKEWKRTLACKLFEERHNADGEGMDSLWETYEEDSSRKDAAKTSKKTKIKGWKKERVNSRGSSSSSSNRVAAVAGLGNDEDGGEEDEGVGMDDKFCCLQALRLSAGRKIGGLGMGRPNIVRISKAFKGMGWLHQYHHHVSHGHGKKG